jgi:hypothetical protein
MPIVHLAPHDLDVVICWPVEMWNSDAEGRFWLLVITIVVLGIFVYWAKWFIFDRQRKQLLWARIRAEARAGAGDDVQ